MNGVKDLLNGVTHKTRQSQTPSSNTTGDVDWMWQRTQDNIRNQIDYIPINGRFRNLVTQVKTYPDADCGSDHVPVLATI